MKPADKSIFCAHILSFAAFLIVCVPHLSIQSVQASLFSEKAKPFSNQPSSQLSGARVKTEADPGKLIGPAADCNGDGIVNDARIDFDGDGIVDECVVGLEEVPEPPFAQTYTPSSDTFYSLLPAVGWQAQYQCGDLALVTLSRPTEETLEYVADGLRLTSRIVYDDLDPNLNQPLVIQDPLKGLRYSFQQERNGEFYEYALANYEGDIGLYVYQTGEQVIATPCEIAS